MRDVVGQSWLEDERAHARAQRWARLSRRSRLSVTAAVVGATAGALLVASGPAEGPGPDATECPGQPGPSSAAAPALAVRYLGGEAIRTSAGARGEVRLEVRNGGPPVRLRSMTAEVPGVRFTPAVQADSVSLCTGERVRLVLAFAVEDCSRLRRTGRVVLRVVLSGLERELGLTVTHDWEAGTVREVALDLVLAACPV